MMKIKKNELNRVIAIIIILVFAVFFIIEKYEELQLFKNNRYTTGKIIDSRSTPRIGQKVVFSYYVNGREYTSFDLIELDRQVTVDELFFVKFDPSNPDNSEILLDHPVPDRLKKDVPPDGWKELPEK